MNLSLQLKEINERLEKLRTLYPLTFHTLNAYTDLLVAKTNLTKMGY
jgi:hypothetical protein